MKLKLVKRKQANINSQLKVMRDEVFEVPADMGKLLLLQGGMYEEVKTKVTKGDD